MSHFTGFTATLAHERIEVEELTNGFWRVIGRYGFMETPDVPRLLRETEARGLALGPRTYFLGREVVVAALGRWRQWTYGLFALMHRNARPAAMAQLACHGRVFFRGRPF